jgi:hypothetical protein
MEAVAARLTPPQEELHLLSDERIPELCGEVLEGKLQTLSFQNLSVAGSEEKTMRLNTSLHNDQRNVYGGSIWLGYHLFGHTN